jgi:nitrous oxide reductase accessory protein NosL
MQKKPDKDRRKLIRVIGAGAAFGAVAATGCLNGGTDGEPEGDGSEDGGDETNGTDESADGEPSEVALDEPTEFPEDAGCPVCNMVPAEFPDWNAQAVHEDGERAYTCSVGCMVAYKAYPEEFGVSDAEIAGVWVTSYATGELIDGFEAYYALENDRERVDDVMMVNPAAFENREGAVGYVDEVDYLTEDDIVGFEELDKDTADEYRGQLTPDGTTA